MANQRIREVVNGSLSGGGGFALVEVGLAGASQLTVWAQLQGTTTGTDLAMTVLVFRKDGTTTASNSLVPVRNTGSVSDSVNVNNISQYDVRGISKVKIFISNANVAAKTGILTVYLGS